MKQLRQSLPTFLVAVLCATLVITQTAAAQDPTQQAMQAAQQATQAAQQATQAAQQASQQAMDAAQQTNAQAAQAAIDNATQSTPAPIVQAPPPYPATPTVVPSQIAGSHTIFLSNLGADANFPIDNNSYYNAIYQQLQNWGRYQLASAPDQADLIFELHGLSTYTTYTGNRGDTYTIDNPSFQLTILDAKTKVTLWTISSPIYLEGRGTTLTRWVNLSETNLVSRLKILANQPLSAAESTDLTTFPKSHALRNSLIVLGSLAVLGGGMYLIARHTLSDMKASQDKFCQDNGIPLSECAGG